MPESCIPVEVRGAPSIATALLKEYSALETRDIVALLNARCNHARRSAEGPSEDVTYAGTMATTSLSKCKVVLRIG